MDMDLEAGVRWIELALLESQDPDLIKAVKNFIKSKSDAENPVSKEESGQDVRRIKDVDVSNYVGKINLEKDALSIQRALRNEWE